MKTNDQGVALITEFEGVRLAAYPDPVHGWKVPTIGIGHTSAAGKPPVTKGMTITSAGAKAILQSDLAKFERYVLDAVKVPLNENQFAALVSFTFNLGPGKLRSSTLLKKLNQGDYAGAADQFKRWNRAGGKVIRGLTRRRLAEEALFRRPPPTTSTPQPATPPKRSPFAAFFQFLANLFGANQ